MYAISPDNKNKTNQNEGECYKSVYDSQLRVIIWFVIKYRDMNCIVFTTVSMWSFHDRLLSTVTPSSLAVEQDLNV